MPEQTARTIELLDGRPVWVTLTNTVTHRCPVDGSTDADHLEVTYYAAHGIIEAGSWETYLLGFEPMALTIEDLVAMVHADLVAGPGIAARVYASGQHGDGTTVEAQVYMGTPSRPR